MYKYREWSELGAEAGKVIGLMVGWEALSDGCFLFLIMCKMSAFENEKGEGKGEGG